MVCEVCGKYPQENRLIFWTGPVSYDRSTPLFRRQLAGPFQPHTEPRVLDTPSNDLNLAWPRRFTIDCL